MSPKRSILKVLFFYYFIIKYETLGLVKIWKYSSGALDYKNWDLSVKNCNGFWFARENSGNILLGNFTTNRLVLPIDGTIQFIDGTSIHMDKNNRQCVQLKSFEEHDLYDYRNWQLSPVNPAMPHLYRVPCEGDTVVLPALADFGRDERTLPIIKMKFSMDASNRGDPQLAANQATHFIRGEGTNCNSLGECEACQPIEAVTCPWDAPIDGRMTRCDSPVAPVGFCSAICGAYIHLEARSLPLNEVRRALNLRGYKSATFASHITNLWGSNEVQIVFAEGEFEGRSLVDSNDFYQFLIEEHNGLSDKIELVQSGGRRNGGGGGGGVVFWIFGPLTLVGAFFGLLIYNGGGGFQFGGLLSRLRSQNFEPSFMARFDPTRENLIIEQQSIAGSIPNLAASFENPMYDSQRSLNVKFNQIDSEAKTSTNVEE